MNWKKALAAVLAVAAVTMIAGCGGNTDKQAAQKLPDKIVIGLDDNFPPMGFRDDSGQLVGFDIDLAQEASKRLGIPVNLSPSTGTARKRPSRANRSTCFGTA